jgi:hypothetical protein
VSQVLSGFQWTYFLLCQFFLNLKIVCPIWFTSYYHFYSVRSLSPFPPLPPEPFESEFYGDPSPPTYVQMHPQEKSSCKSPCLVAPCLCRLCVAVTEYLGLGNL